MKYQQTVDWLFTQFPAYQNVGIIAYKPDLINVLELCDFFEVDYHSLKYIHIAGTNGKGSTANFLASILQEANYKVGLFTSPHILDFRERIRINGQMIAEEKVISFCQKIQVANHSGKFKIQPSFFEITFILALIHFIEQKCEICVIETGLGGRLDATNIIHPILSIITSISLDHINILGNTVEQIAFEKAGIIKKNTPLIAGFLEPKSENVVLEQAKKMNANLYFPDVIQDAFFPKNTYLYKNEVIVRKACELLVNYNYQISKNQIELGFKNVFKNTGFIGRFQIISEKPKIIVDAAHNEAGIVELLKLVEKNTYNKLLVIYGASNDKNVNEILCLFPKHTQFILTQFSNNRSLTLAELIHLSESLENQSTFFEDIEKAYIHTKSVQNEDDILLITGSFFLLSDFFTFFSKKDLTK
jgi:dihydrofolate synthase / folylpolyglutamate synthase